MERVIGIDELQSGDRRSVYVDDIPALVIRIQDQYFVIEDVCSHDGQPLTEGAITDCSITCPRHSARFDLKTGKALCMPAIDPIRVFRTEIREGALGRVVKNHNGTSILIKTTRLPGLAAMTTEVELIDALKQVIDPELMVNIVDLGLVYSVNQVEGKVTVEMTLTSPACPAGPQIIQQAKMALERLDDVQEAAIVLTMSPPWTPDRMTDDAKDQLGIF